MTTRKQQPMNHVAQPTPGPWKVQRNAHFIEIGCEDGDDTPIATTHARRTVSGDRPNQIANAHLIAAAPELLAACEAALRWHTMPATGFPSYLIGQLKTAIEKARS